MVLFQAFVKDKYLEYKVTDDTTIMLDPEKTSFWFTLGPRALEECDQLKLLTRVGEVSTKFKFLYNTLIISVFLNCVRKSLSNPVVFNL